MSDPVSEPSKPQGNWWKRQSRLKKILLIVGAIFAILIVIGIVAPTDDNSETAATTTVTETETQPAETTTAEQETTTEPETTETQPQSSSSNKATDENEPHVGQNGTVIVDTLTWRVLSVRQARELGGEFSRETPDGVYVVVKTRVRNGKTESVTINSDIAELEVAGNSYASDSDGTIAMQLDGDDETFFLKDLGPSVSTQGTFVFDVPPSALNKVMEICFGELGFGSTKGCIRLN